MQISMPTLAGWTALGTGATAPLRALAQKTGGSVDSRGPERLISLGGGITEVVYELGAEHMLVGTDTTSLYPLAAQATAKVGYLRSLSAEGLLALRPTALVASSEAGPPVVLDQLRSAGIRLALVQADHTWTEVQRKVMAVGEATRRMDAAKRLWQQLDAQWQDVQTRVKATAGRGPKVLFILSHSGSPMVSGQGTAADAMIRFMGARNALSSFKGYRPMTAEAMAAAAPDTVLMTTQGLEALGGAEKFWSRPELALTPAWRQRQQSHALVHRDALELLGFTPRMPALVAALQRQLVRA
ncbi:MAG: hemin ABC transporter substrate-binding protein [Burkholderiales bacterium]